MSSKKGVKRFYTPELKQSVDDYLLAKEQLDQALSASARKLYASFSKRFALWHRAVRTAADLDCLLSLATVSGGVAFCKPVFVTDHDAAPFLHITRASTSAFRRRSARAPTASPTTSTTFVGPGGRRHADADDTDFSPPMLLVTGPNMGGKSTLLRQACLTRCSHTLGQCPPAECRLSPVDRIFTRVGANDAIMAGLSTFRVELEETAAILRHATSSSIVILDELGRGTAGLTVWPSLTPCSATSPTGWAASSLFATHYHALTRGRLRSPTPKVALYHMACAVDEASRDVTFLYQFAKGASHRSHGVNVARLAGLPASVLDLARARKLSKDAAHLAARLLAAADPKVAARHHRLRGRRQVRAATSTRTLRRGLLAGDGRRQLHRVAPV